MTPSVSVSSGSSSPIRPEKDENSTIIGSSSHINYYNSVQNRCNGDNLLLDRVLMGGPASKRSLSAKTKIMIKSNVEGKLLHKGTNENLKVDELLSSYSRKLQSNCYASSRASAYGNGTETFRNIPLEPERILDAPGIVDDFYLNCLSWSVKDILAIGLGSCVYLWNSRSGEVNELLNLGDDGEESISDYVSSLSWIHDGSHLAVGSSDSSVQIWDVNKSKKLRMFAGHSGRVSSLAWNKHILSSGAHDGQIHTSDVRIAKHLISKQVAHTGQVCGLQWNYDGKQLASGSNDNHVHIWDGPQSSVPTFSFSHTAAVKALSWCPWQSNTLVSGGGTRDRQLKFWNTSTGSCSRSIDTGNQVSAIMWSKTYRELVSAHGYSSNSLNIWKYPSLAHIKEIPAAHDSRILHMAMSPDGERIATVASDENLKIWKVFEKPSVPKSTKTSHSSLDRPLITISHMTETSAKFKNPAYTENFLSRR
jgi:cell division cycle 20, cofactor of APC complex